MGLSSYSFSDTDLIHGAVHLFRFIDPQRYRLIRPSLKTSIRLLHHNVDRVTDKFGSESGFLLEFWTEFGGK